MKPVLRCITTAKQAEAKEITQSLLEARLIASANIIPGVVSLYRWHGKIEEAAVQQTEAMHSYECPRILVLPVASGSRCYFDRIADETCDLK
ncbi:MAG: divalent cation tolerance protein CutA [Proteobacteria bacterium]|nr:divalent cation tolerance protein CutA [Pseudomonadota bacterium]MDA1355020.1 divalent cation tolerance protein CutA [Pseudomonadota bacterium]